MDQTGAEAMNTTTYTAVNRPHPTSPVAVRDAINNVPRKPPAGQDALAFLSEAERLSLLQRSAVQDVVRREVVFHQGDPGSSVILVSAGYIKLSTPLEGREVVLDIVGPGSCFGEMAVLNKWPRETDATALSRCRLVAIDGRHYRQAVERKPEGLLAAMRLVSERLQRTTERMVDAVALTAPARLAKTLIHLARLRSTSLHHGDSAPLRLSQSELGSMTGLTRESVNKHLSVWRDAGWVLLSGGSVTVIDVAALSNLLSETSGLPGPLG
jgi:CRP-like cAMP-binding protein